LFLNVVWETIMHHVKPAPEAFGDYFVIIKRCGRHRGARRTSYWTWEILSRSKTLDAKFAGDRYATPQEAKLAGEKTLSWFLQNLSQD